MAAIRIHRLKVWPVYNKSPVFRLHSKMLTYKKLFFKQKLGSFDYIGFEFCKVRGTEAS